MADIEQMFTKEEIEERKKQVRETRRCPHCDDPLKKWMVPQTHFTQWPNEFMYICFNDECSYYIRNKEVMVKMGNTGSQRLMWDPELDCCQPVPVPNSSGLRDGIVAEDESKPEGKGFFSSLFSKFSRKGDK